MKGAASTVKKKTQCLSCGLYKAGCTSPRMQVTGLGEKGILIISDYPTGTDDRNSSHLSGESGKLLQEELKKHDVHIYNDVWRINVVNCRPVDSRSMAREPKAKEIKCCSAAIETAIKELKPKKVIILGNSLTIKAIYGPRIKRMSTPVCRGLRFRDNNWGCWVYTIYHPKTLLADHRNDLLRDVWNRDIEFIIKDDKVFSKIIIDTSKLNILTTAESIVKVLRVLLKNKGTIAFDYETTNLKPYQKGQKLLSCSYTTEDYETYTFPIQHKVLPIADQLRIMKMWAKVIADPKIFKVVAGYTMETSWSEYVLKVASKGFLWDTQLATHILDNRPGITGLKFQLFQKFGIEEYDKGAKKYIKPAPGSDFNRMEEMPLIKMLRYNGIDSYGTMLLFHNQRKEFRGDDKKDLRRAYKFYHRSLDSLTQMHINGLSMDSSFYEDQQATMRKKVAVLDATLDAHFAEHNVQTGVDLSYTSNDDLKTYFFDHLGLTPTAKTKTGQPSMTAEALGKIDNPIAQTIIERRKMEKLNTTYIAGLRQETHDGILRPLFSLSTVSSYRSSSQRPNGQNWPTRDKFSKQTIRGGMRPRPGYCLYAIDYSGAEIGTAQIITQDQGLLHFLTVPGSDMHRTSTAHVFMLEEEQVSDLLRKDAKSCLFGAFYGSAFRSLAEVAWEYIGKHTLDNGTTLVDHLSSNGISNLSAFTDHMKEYEKWLWEELFPQYGQWKKDIVKEYKRNGYLTNPFGFRFTDVMNERQCSNFPIQSTSFMALMWVINYVQVQLVSRGMRSRTVLQIHDELVSEVPYEELQTYHDLFYEGIDKLNNTYDWITLDYTADGKITALYEDGGNLVEMEKVNKEDDIVSIVDSMGSSNG